MVIAVVDELARAPETLKRLEVGHVAVHSFDHGSYGFGGKGFCIELAMNSVMPASLPP